MLEGLVTSHVGWGALTFGLLSACAEGGVDRNLERGAANSDAPTLDPATRVEAPQPPALVLPPGSRYFEREGIRAPVLMRNVSAPSAAAFTPLLRAASEAGTTVIRLQITQGFGYQTLGMDSRGAVLSSWAASWDAVLDEAARQGLSIIVVFTLWGDWNDGTPALGWSHFDANPLGRGRGGPAASPADLFADTETQRLWLGWLSELIERWSSRPNVMAWEIFSELDLATGATEANATAFVEKAHAVVRSIDAWRPAFASTSDLPLILGLPWQTLWDSPGNDLTSIHPYSQGLDAAAVDRARTVLQLSPKPVLIGESGLDAAAPEGMTLTSSPRAEVGLGHAIWAELVSGAASARALYWEDGYAVYYPATGLPLVTRYDNLERQAARWLAGKDFRDLAAVGVSGEPPLFGTALVSASRVHGWVRNELLAAPEWSAPPLDRALVRVPLPANIPDSSWAVLLTRPEDGTQTETMGSSSQQVLSFAVAGPFDSVAFDGIRGEEAPPNPALGPVCPSVETGTCVGPVYGVVLNGTSLFANPECPSAGVFVGLTQCRDASWDLLLSSCPDGVAPLSCVVLSVGDIGGEATGGGEYYDSAGVLFEVVVNEGELALDRLDQQVIRSGVLRGSVSGGDAGVQPFELTFSGCSPPAAVCLR